MLINPWNKEHYLRLFLIGLFFLFVPSSGYATDAQLVVWDDLYPGNKGYSQSERSVINPHQTGQSENIESLLPSLNEFDPLNDGQQIVETWGQEDYEVVTALIGTEIILDGHVLPLIWESDRIIEFLLVPWVGACIHTPAPPPNQIIYVSYPDGLVIREPFEAVRLAGTLRHEPADHDLFLVDGNRRIPVSYTLHHAKTAGAAGKVTASVTKNLPAFAQIQMWTNSLFTGSMTAIAEDGASKTLLIALMLSFAYGVFHTLGPGHGKSVVVSYFVGAGGSAKHGLTMGVRIAVFHVLSAITIVLFLDLAVRQTTGAAPSDYRSIRMVSYALIVLIGTAMLWRSVSDVLSRRPVSKNGHTSSSHCGHYHETQTASNQSGCSACAATNSPPGSGWIAASIGVVPCTGAMIVMLYGLANDMIFTAILMVLLISAGMATAMSAIGVAAIWGRNIAESRIALNEERTRRFEVSARLVGGACVFAIGTILLLFTALSPAGSQSSFENVSMGNQNSIESDI
ncbi:MAG: DUF3299 domain-containing protein [Pseudomonadota bacterium]